MWTALLWLALGWTAIVLVTGGVEYGAFTSREPVRPFTIALVCLAVVAWRSRRDGRPAGSGAGQRPATGRLVAPALTLAVIAGAFGVVYGSRVAAASDQHGYVSQADRWLAADLAIAQPWVADAPWPNAAWTFAPLGYRPAATDTGAIVPTYPPGLPLLMAAAKIAGGQSALFLVVPLSGALLVLATWGLGVRLGSPAAGLVAALLVGTSPVTLEYLALPMTDVPVSAAWAGTACLVLGRRRWEPAAAGALAAIAIAIRPNLAFLALVLAAWYPLDAVRRGAGWAAGLRSSGTLIGVASLGAAIVAVVNNALYGSPWMSGYGNVDGFFAAGHVVANLGRYPVWLLETHTPFVLAGVAALFLARVWPGPRAGAFRWILLTAVVSVWLTYVAYLVFDDWRFLRFLLPTLPILMLGTGLVVVAMRVTGPRRVAAAVTVVVSLAAVLQVKYAVEHGVLDIRQGEERYAAAGRAVAGRVPDDAVVIALQHSGSARYYGGRITLRYDQLEPEWLDRAVEWMRAHDTRVFGLFDAFELEVFERRFAGQTMADARRRQTLWILSSSPEVVLVEFGVDDVGRPAVTPPGRADDTPVPAIGPMPTPAWAR